MIEEYRKAEFEALNYPKFKPGPLRKPTDVNIQNIPKFLTTDYAEIKHRLAAHVALTPMHVPQETIALANVLAGNFQVIDPAMIDKIKRAGKEVMVLQFPRSTEAVLRDVAGKGSDFDRMMVNVLDVLQGLANPNTGVHVNINTSNSVFRHTAEVARQAIGHFEKITQLEKLNDYINKAKTETEERRLRAEKVKVDSDLKLAHALVIDRESEQVTIEEKIKQLNVLVEELSALTKDPTLTASIAVKKARAQKAKNSEFEDMLSKLADEK